MTLLPRLAGVRGGLIAIAGGTALGQVVALAASPVLSRLYSPADFGAFSVGVALVLVLGTVSTLRYELAIPLADEARAHSLVALTTAIVVAMGASALAVSLFAGREITHLLHRPALRPWLWSVPVSAVLFSLYTVLNQLAIRRKDFAAVGRRNLLQGCSLVLFQIGLGVSGLGAGGLLAGFGAGQAVGVVSLFSGAGLRSVTAKAGRSLENVLRVARRYRRFPLLLAPAALLNMIGLQLPVVLVSSFYGGEAAGWFGLAQRVLAPSLDLGGYRRLAGLLC